jgi:hypothetical protein
MGIKKGRNLLYGRENKVCGPNLHHRRRQRKRKKKYHHRKIQLLEKARENCQGSRIATGQMGTITNSSSFY